MRNFRNHSWNDELNAWECHKTGFPTRKVTQPATKSGCLLINKDYCLHCAPPYNKYHKEASQ